MCQPDKHEMIIDLSITHDEDLDDLEQDHEGEFEPDRFASDKQRQNVNVLADEAFQDAMKLQIKRGREKVTAGTTIDLTPPIGAKFYRGSFPASYCGSPSAMCVESAVQQAGAVAMAK